MLNFLNQVALSFFFFIEKQLFSQISFVCQDAKLITQFTNRLYDGEHIKIPCASTQTAM